MPDMEEVKNIFWLAGLIEGEGCFDMANKITPRIRVGMTDLDIVIRAAIILNAPNVIGASRKIGKKTYNIALHGDPAISWMMKLYPYMGKRRQNKIMECFLKWKERENWTGRRKQKKKKGPALSSLRTVWINEETNQTNEKEVHIA